MEHTFKEKKKFLIRGKSQDISWIERSIIDEFGQKGKEQIKDLMNYSSNPFKTLYELRNYLVKELELLDHHGSDIDNTESPDLKFSFL